MHVQNCLYATILAGPQFLGIIDIGVFLSDQNLNRRLDLVESLLLEYILPCLSIHPHEICPKLII